MNEKMNKLWDQVKLQECDCGCNPDEFLRLKFAELIVKECADIAGCNGHVSGFTLGDLIKEHFGVKE